MENFWDFKIGYCSHALKLSVQRVLPDELNVEAATDFLTAELMQQIHAPVFKECLGANAET